MTKCHGDPILCPRCNVPVVAGDRETCGHGETVSTYTCPECGLWTKARGPKDIDTGWFEPLAKYDPQVARTRLCQLSPTDNDKSLGYGSWYVDRDKIAAFCIRGNEVIEVHLAGQQIIYVQDCAETREFLLTAAEGS